MFLSHCIQIDTLPHKGPLMQTQHTLTFAILPFILSLPSLLPLSLFCFFSSAGTNLFPEGVMVMPRWAADALYLCPPAASDVRRA